MVLDFSKSGFLYCIQQGDKNIFKVGITQHSPLKRLRQLQTGNSEKLYLTGYLHVLDMSYAEKYVHRLFSETRLEGEWFEGDNEEIQRWLIKSDNNCTFPQENNLAHYLTLLEMKLWHFKEQVQGELIFSNYFKIGWNTTLYLSASRIDNTKYPIEIGYIFSDRRNTIDAAALSLVKRLLQDFSRFYVHYLTVDDTKHGCFFFERNAQDRKDIFTFDSLPSEKKIELIDRNRLYLPD